MPEGLRIGLRNEANSRGEAAIYSFIAAKIVQHNFRAVCTTHFDAGWNYLTAKHGARWEGNNVSTFVTERNRARNSPAVGA